MLLNEKSAAQFGSEGQKRTLAIALKMAQAEYLAGIHGSPPILLIDDVMGELDVKRRSGFFPLLNRAHQARGQVFMTCTEENWPRELGKELQRWEVKTGTRGKFDRLDAKDAKENKNFGALGVSAVNHPTCVPSCGEFPVVNRVD